MKIMNQVTIRYLKENKKRTIFTLLCITISVIMISCVGIAFYSGNHFVQEFVKNTVGDYHYYILNADKQDVNLIQNDDEIEEYYFDKFDILHDTNNEDYEISLSSGDSLYFSKNHYSKYILEGRLPQNSQEIVISKYYLKMIYQDKKTIGDKIEFYQWIDNNKKIKRSFQIVGLMNTQNTGYQNYNAISYINVNQENYFNIYIRDKNESDNIFTHISTIAKKIGEDKTIEYNSSYLESINIYNEESNSSAMNIYKLVAIIIFIIIFISYFIIYQAFHLSTYDRIQYLGMLSSVGATSKQKKRSVYFEGLILSIIAIPIGIIISFIILFIAFFFINKMDFLTHMDLKIYPQLSLFYFIMIILFSIIIIMISLYRPARKISKISVIDALNKSDELKVKKKKLKQNKLLKKLLNFDQQLALKNYKRQGNRTKVIVFSLVASMVAFISLYSFGKLMMNEVNQNQEKYPYEVSCSVNYDSQDYANNYLKDNEKINNFIACQTLNIHVDIDSQYLDDELENINIEMFMIGVDSQTYSHICKDNHIKAKNNQILIFNTPYQIIDYDGNTTYTKKRFKKMDNHFIKSMSYINDDNEIINISSFQNIECIQTDNYDLNNDFDFIMIVSLEKTCQLDKNISIDYRIQTQQHEDVVNELNAMNLQAFDKADYDQQNQQLFYAVSIFVYGFVFIMISFTLLNIMNMMSASIEKRRKEFGMLLSVGMSPHHIQRMIFYESFIYGLKTFIYGVPLSLLVEFILYKQVENEKMIFIPSYFAYLVSFIIIMMIMLFTFRIGLQRFQKQNIIETLKDDI